MIHPATYDNVRQAVDRAFELFPLELRGKRVLFKPNVLRASEPHEAVTTHPAVLRAVVKRVEAMGPAALVVGDNPGMASYGANEEAFRKTGLMHAAQGYYQNIGNNAKRVPFNTDFMPVVSLSRAVLDADVIISLPKFKTHGLTVITGAIKNSYGFLPGAQKAQLHKAAGTSQRFHEMMVEVFQLRVPDLVLVDAVVGMEGNGPVSNDLRDIGQEAGLGNYDHSEIELIGDLKRLPDFKFPPLGGEWNLDNAPLQTAFHSHASLRPRADPELCTGCGTCIDQCPVAALTMSDHLPEVNADTCIRCFCCQEICPEKAITLQ
jgi:uncharacterized protein (DUF362 family)/NAD-dependent dihydropyrimidine dehydrogenase PreA subunit